MKRRNLEIDDSKKMNKNEFKKELEIAKQDPAYFYKLSLGRGVDYNFYGDWQKSYAKMVLNICEILKRTGKAKPNVLDVGCACGVNTRAFKELGIFSSVRGCDPSDFMIDLGRKTHGFSEDELFVSHAEQLVGIKNGSIDFLHCSNVLEHCDETNIRTIMNEFYRVLQPEGMVFIILPAITEVQTQEDIADNEDHSIVKPFTWWENHFNKRFEFNSEIYQKFEADKHSPDNSSKTFFDYYNTEWSLFLLTRR